MIWSALKWGSWSHRLLAEFRPLGISHGCMIGSCPSNWPPRVFTWSVYPMCLWKLSCIDCMNSPQTWGLCNLMYGSYGFDILLPRFIESATGCDWVMCWNTWRLWRYNKGSPLSPITLVMRVVSHYANWYVWSVLETVATAEESYKILG